MGASVHFCIGLSSYFNGTSEWDGVDAALVHRGTVMGCKVAVMGGVLVRRCGRGQGCADRPIRVRTQNGVSVYQCRGAHISGLVLFFQVLPDFGILQRK